MPASARIFRGFRGFSRTIRARIRSLRSSRRLSRAIIEAMEPRILLSPFPVTNSGDGNNSQNTSGTLRFEIHAADNAANSTGDVETVTFVGVTGTLTLGVSNGALVIDNTAGQVIIQGPGAGALTISANRHSSVFIIDSPAHAQIEGLTILHGSSGSGGGIVNEGDLTVSDCIVTGSTTTGDGGGIYNADYLSLKNSYVYNNIASDNGLGGGIANRGTAVITDSTISSNAAVSGAGIYSDYGANLTVTGSTISGNQAQENGGGINGQGYFSVSESTISGNGSQNGSGAGIYGNHGMSISDSTINSNTAHWYGGGIDNRDTGGDRLYELSIINSTIAYNSAPSAGGIGNSGYLTATDCTISGNTGYGIVSVPQSNYIQANVYGTIVTDGTAGSIQGDDNLFSSDADLSPLGNFGGPTQTMALLPGSPAIGQGDALLDSTDQRGFERSNSSPDIGAFQTQSLSTTGVNPLEVNTSLDDAIGPYLDNPIGLGQLSLRDAINLADAFGGDRTITFAPALAGSTITLNGSALTLNDASGTLTIQGLGASSLTVSGGNITNVFTVASGSAVLWGLTVSDGDGSSNGGGIRGHH